MNAKPHPCKVPAKIVSCHPLHPEIEVVEAAAAEIRSGKVVCFPTRCLYGLAADARNPVAVNRVFEIKQRPAGRPILVLIDSFERLDELALRIPPSAYELISRFWPGNLTLVFEARRSVPEPLTAGTGRIGIRMPGHPVARALVNAVEGPITGTSANISGTPGCRLGKDIPESVLSGCSTLLDCGPLEGGAGSTVVDVSRGRPRVLREGVIASALTHSL